MDKTIITEFINKYTLGGTIKSMVWNIDNLGKLSGRCIAPDKSVVLELNSKNIVFHNKKLKGQDLPIYETPNLTRLLYPLTDEISFGLSGTELKVYDDEDTQMSFILSHSSTIPTPPQLKNLPSIFEVNFTLDSKFIKKMISSSGASSSWETFTIFHQPKGISKMCLGYASVKSNCIQIPFETEKTKTCIDKISFALNPFVAFLKSHQDCDEISVELSKKGLCRLTANNKNFNSTAYFISTQPIK